MKISDRALNIWYRCALALCGAFVLINVHNILDSASFFNPSGVLTLVFFGLATFFLFQKNRGCQLAGWMCSAYFSSILFFEGLNVLMSSVSNLRGLGRMETYLWSNIKIERIEHARRYVELNSALLVMITALLIPSAWLLIRRLRELMREDDEARAKENANVDEILAAPVVKIEKPKASKASKQD